jgi:hypothetical protein
MPGSCDKEEKRNALRLHLTIQIWRLLDAYLTTALRILYASGQHAWIDKALYNEYTPAMGARGRLHNGIREWMAIFPAFIGSVAKTWEMC